jgi:uncharacterized membrane protein YhdT
MEGQAPFSNGLWEEEMCFLTTLVFIIMCVLVDASGC